MESAKQSKRLHYKDYVFDILAISDMKLKLCILNQLNDAIYEQEQIQLKRINVESIIQALKGRIKQLSVNIDQIVCENDKILQIQIKVSHSLLPAFSEKIYCKKTKELSELQYINQKLIDVPPKLQQIRNSLDKFKEKRMFHFASQLCDASSGNQKSIAQLNLKKGKYLITLSFLVECRNQWLYIGHSKIRALFCDQQGFYLLPEGKNLNTPIVLRAVYKITEQQQLFKIVTFSNDSYQAILRNVVMTAQKLSD